MNNKLEDYVKIYQNVLSNSLCDDIVKELEGISNKFTTHTFYNHIEDKNQLTGNDSLVLYETINHNDIIMKLLWETLYKYIGELQFEWFYAWDGFSRPKFNKYAPGMAMREHCDHIHDLFDDKGKGIPKLSIICSLNNNYSGGEFVMFKNTPYKLNAGDIIIFPSIFLYPHRINPVLQGVRYSFASWVW